MKYQIIGAAIGASIAAMTAVSAAQAIMPHAFQCNDGTRDVVTDSNVGAACALHGGKRNPVPSRGSFVPGVGQDGMFIRAADGSYGGKNVATWWTTQCYRQFGADARYPDSGLLRKCLSH